MVTEAGGEAGSRIGKAVGIHRSADTYLRYLRRQHLPEQQPPRVIGIDDWAWRKGTRYGTIICDLERSKVIDVLPDRENQTVIDWLKRFPTVQVISRDRATGYREAARQGAPRAIQVADRWHLLHNLFECTRRALESYRPLTKQIDKAVRSEAPCKSTSAQLIRTIEVAPVDIWNFSGDIDQLKAMLQQDDLPPALRRRINHEMIHQLHQQGVPVKLIMKHVGLSRASLYRYLKMDHLPTIQIVPVSEPNRQLTARQLRDQKIVKLREAGVTVAEIVHRLGCSRATVYRTLAKVGQSHLGKRDYFPGVESRSWKKRFAALWESGNQDLQVLWETLVAEGYRMSFGTVRRAVHQRYNHIPISPALDSQNRSKSPREVALLFVKDPAHLSSCDARFIHMALQTSTLLLQLYALSQGFCQLIRNRRSIALFEHWLDQATESQFPEFQRFATGLRQDEDAIRAALILPWSNGPVEGHISRLKAIRRQMYGRGKLDLLKRRIILN